MTIRDRVVVVVQLVVMIVATGLVLWALGYGQGTGVDDLQRICDGGAVTVQVDGALYDCDDWRTSTGYGF